MLLTWLSIKAQAKQIFEASNGDTVSAAISTNDLTRIEIDGQKIIKSFSSANVSKKQTKPLGQVYIIPNTEKTFSLFIVSDTGNTYNLRLTPSKNASGDSIIIKPINNGHLKTSGTQFKSNTYIRNINYLLETMYLNKNDDINYNLTEVSQVINTYTDLDSVLLKTYTNDSLIGYVLLLKNTSKNKILLTEAEFYSPKTLAVAIENPNLLSNAFTRVFIVKEVDNAG